MICLSCLAVSAATLFTPVTSDLQTHTFANPIDGISVQFEEESDIADVSYFADGTWSAWQTLEVDNEQDPLLRESNMIMFPQKVEKIRIKSTDDFTVKPLRVSDAPVRYNVAALSDANAPRILSRSEWGADEDILVRTTPTPSSNNTTETPATGDNGGTTPSRMTECEEAQLNYPDEFKIKRRVTKDDSGRTLRWAWEYSKKVDVIAVHHTAIGVSGDKRSGAERVRALYTYHANNRGWGDVGYHYLIDEDGKIYEGKSGGEYVIGGHAYCNNTNTLGVALLGNFEEEKPTQDQLKALQWLLKDLADTYNIDVTEQVTYRGKKIEPIVGHRDLISTACPGYYIYGSLNQIRAHVAKDDVYASVKLPAAPATARSSARPKISRASAAKSSAPRDARSRALQRLLDSRASQALRRKLGSNPGRETESGVAARLAARTSGSRASVSSRARSSRSSVSSRSATSRSTRSSVRSSARSSVRSVRSTAADAMIRIRLTRQEKSATSCSEYNMEALSTLYRGEVECIMVDDKPALINTVSLEDYMAGLAEEPDTEPYEKQKAFAIAARTYAAYYSDTDNLRKFPGKPYDGSDSPATFQLYVGITFERSNPRWVDAVRETAGIVIMKDNVVIRAPYFSSDDGRTRSPSEAGWNNFPFAEIFASKEDPYCAGMTMRGHGVGMSGCGSEGMANNGYTHDEILKYYYPGTEFKHLSLH